MKNISETKTLTIALPKNLYQSLEIIALEQDRSKNYLIKKAVENFVQNFLPLTTSNKSPSKKAQNPITSSKKLTKKTPKN